MHNNNLSHTESDLKQSDENIVSQKTKDIC